RHDLVALGIECNRRHNLLTLLLVEKLSGDGHIRGRFDHGLHSYLYSIGHLRSRTTIARFGAARCAAFSLAPARQHRYDMEGAVSYLRIAARPSLFDNRSPTGGSNPSIPKAGAPIYNLERISPYSAIFYV